MSKEATSAPSLELPLADSLMAMGPLEVCLEAARDLAKVDALAGIEAFEAAEREPKQQMSRLEQGQEQESSLQRQGQKPGKPHASRPPWTCQP